MAAASIRETVLEVTVAVLAMLAAESLMFRMSLPAPVTVRAAWMPATLLALPTLTVAVAVPVLTAVGLAIAWTLTVSEPDPVLREVVAEVAAMVKVSLPEPRVMLTA